MNTACSDLTYNDLDLAGKMIYKSIMMIEWMKTSKNKGEVISV